MAGRGPRGQSFLQQVFAKSAPGFRAKEKSRCPDKTWSGGGKEGNLWLCRGAASLVGVTPVCGDYRCFLKMSLVEHGAPVAPGSREGLFSAGHRECCWGLNAPKATVGVS